jgi:dGTPase
MDVADDIAYSTYDLEDAFKSKFLSPFQLIAADREIVEKVRISVGKRLSGFTDKDVRETLKSIFVDLFEPESTLDAETQAIVAYIASRKITDNGYYRSNFTSKLVGGFVRAVKIVPNSTHPALSKIEIDENSLRKIEVLKHFAYQALILSPDLKVTSYRGREITEKLFNILSDGSKGGHELLPNDVRMQYEAVDDELLRKRIVCDFIAGMTDRYAVEYYGRLTSEKPQTLFKPLF